MTPYTKFLENEEIFLRAPEPEDLEVMYDLENDSSLWSVGCTNAPYSRHHLRQYIENVTGDIFTDKQLRFMIERRTDHQVIGCIDLTALTPSMPAPKWASPYAPSIASKDMAAWHSTCFAGMHSTSFTSTSSSPLSLMATKPASAFSSARDSLSAIPSRIGYALLTAHSRMPS